MEKQQNDIQGQTNSRIRESPIGEESEQQNFIQEVSICQNNVEKNVIYKQGQKNEDEIIKIGQTKLEYEESLEKKRKYSKGTSKIEQMSKRLKVILGIFVVITLTLLTGLIFLVVLQLNQSSDSSIGDHLKVPSIIENNFTSNVCTSVECVRAAAEILNSMNLMVDPCEDFYGFVCNNWIKNHPIPKSHSSWSVTDEMSKANLQILRHLLEMPINSSSSKSEQKAQLFYRSCMDSKSQNKHTLQEIIRKTGGWNLTKTKDNIDDGFDLSNFDLRHKLILVQEFTTDALFFWSVREGMDDSKNHEIFIHQGGLTLQSRELYKDAHALKALHQYLTSIVVHLETSGKELNRSKKKDLESQIDDVINFERTLAEFSVKENLMAGTFVSLEDADHLLPLTSNWKSWTSFFNEISQKMLNLDEFVNPDSSAWIQRSYLISLRNYFATHFKLEQENQNEKLGNPGGSSGEDSSTFYNTINNYLTFRALLPYVPFASKKFQSAEKRFWKTIHGGRGSEEMWTSCVTRTVSALGNGIAPAYVKHSFAETSKQSAINIIETIKEAFKIRLDKLDWITDDSTRKAMKSKIDNGRHLIGYPDYIFNQTQLDLVYQDFLVNEKEYCQNQVRFFQFALRRNMNFLSRKVDRTRWPLMVSPMVVNTFYLYSRNVMIFPAGILRPPLFDANQPMALNFGQIGSFMGHELLHGFDNNGRLFNPNGQKMTWWPHSVIQSYTSKTKCFVKQYSKQLYSGAYLDGILTLSENIADNGGLMAAYLGYKRWSHNNQNEVVALPGLESFNDDQLFFISYARGYCSNIRRKAFDLSLLIDSHSPKPARVNTAVSNMEHFQTAFKCQRDAQQDSRRCLLW